ncbi:MAG: hypothetical protein ABI406_11800 [Ktedonobacteraceae bacterium]
MNCPLCSTKITQKDVTCPRCGTEVASMFVPPPVNSTATLHVAYYKRPPPPVKKKKTIIFITGIIAFVLVLSCIGSSTAYIIYRYNISRDPYPPYSNALLFNESLASANSNNDWAVNSDAGGGCAFTGGAYHVTVVQPDAQEECASHYADLFDFIYEAQMTIIHGNCGGIFFRANYQVGGYYYYEVCKGNRYFLSFIQLPPTNTAKLVLSRVHLLTGGTDPGLHTESGAAILIAVVAVNETFALYLNRQKVGTVTDDTNTYGGIGVAAHETSLSGVLSATTDVAFSNVRVWVVQNH